eukprot:229573-Chlamydomonas_euryale.AAC.2
MARVCMWTSSVATTAGPGRLSAPPPTVFEIGGGWGGWRGRWCHANAMRPNTIAVGSPTYVMLPPSGRRIQGAGTAPATHTHRHVTPPSTHDKPWCVLPLARRIGCIADYRPGPASTPSGSSPCMPAADGRASDELPPTPPGC